MKQFLKFGVVGTIGFIVDASILLVLVYMFTIDISISRVFSFLGAVFITWLLNRSFTFQYRNESCKRKEYVLYLSIQTIGAILNYSIFISLVYLYTFFEKYLIIPLAISSILAMFFNYFMTKKFLYKNS